MARGFLRVHRIYNYIDKNPVIDKVRTILQDEGLINKLGIVHEICDVSYSTVDGWLNGGTRNPQHHTVARVITGLGYEEQFVKKKDIDIEAERKAAAAWLEKQEKLKPKKKPKANGHGRPAKKRSK